MFSGRSWPEGDCGRRRLFGRLNLNCLLTPAVQSRQPAPHLEPCAEASGLAFHRKRDLGYGLRRRLGFEPLRQTLIVPSPAGHDPPALTQGAGKTLRQMPERGEGTLLPKQTATDH